MYSERPSKCYEKVNDITNVHTMKNKTFSDIMTRLRVATHGNGRHFTPSGWKHFSALSLLRYITCTGGFRDILRAVELITNGKIY
jgi:hypothetical protein